MNKLLQVDTLSADVAPIQGARWELIFRQTSGSFRPVSEWLLVNQDAVDKSSGDYSVLQRLEDFRRADGLFELKLVWPGSAHEDQVWRQSTNPVTKGSGGVDGYSAVSAPHATHFWGGLEYNGDHCLLDGSVDHSRWFYAVGSRAEYSGGIPGPDGTVDSVELYAWVEDTAAPTWISETGILVCGTDATAAQFPNASMGGAYITHGPVPAGVALRTSVPASATSSEYVFYCLNDGYVKVLVVRVSSSGGKLYASAQQAKYQRCPTGTVPGASLANTVADGGASTTIAERNFAGGYGVFFEKVKEAS